MCDLSYVAQAEALERQALAMMALAPHIEDGSKVPTPDEALREFQEWLVSKPEELDMAPDEVDLMSLIGVTR